MDTKTREKISRKLEKIERKEEILRILKKMSFKNRIEILDFMDFEERTKILSKLSSKERTKTLFGLNKINQFSADARNITIPAVIPRSMSAFFDIFHDTVAHNKLGMFLVEARVGAGKSTIFENLISSINNNNLVEFIEEESIDIPAHFHQDYSEKRGIAFRIELSAEPSIVKYITKIFSQINFTLKQIDNNLLDKLQLKISEKVGEIKETFRDKETEELHHLISTFYLLLDKKEGLGFDYILVVVDEFDTVIPPISKKDFTYINNFLDFVVRKFADNLRIRKPFWTTESPSICMVMLCTHFNVDQVKGLIEKSTPAVSRSLAQCRLGYSRSEFPEIVRKRLGPYRSSDFREDNNIYPFTGKLLDQIYNTFFDKGLNLLTNVGIAEQTLSEILSTWDSMGTVDYKKAEELIEEKGQREHREESEEDIEILLETNEIVNSEDVDIRLSHILEGFLEILKRNQINWSKIDLEEPILIKSTREFSWINKPYELEYQGKHRIIFVSLVEFIEEPTEKTVESFMNDLVKTHEKRIKQMPVPQGIIVLYRASRNLDDRIMDKFNSSGKKYFNLIKPQFLDQSALENLIKREIAKIKNNSNISQKVTQKLAYIVTDVQRFLIGIKDLTPTKAKKKLDSQSKRTYISLLFSELIDNEVTTEIISENISRIYVQYLEELTKNYGVKTVKKSVSGLESIGLVRKMENEVESAIPHSLEYFSRVVKELGIQNREILERIMGKRWEFVKNLLEDYGLLNIEGVSVDLTMRDIALIDYNNMKGEIMKIAEEIVDGKKEFPLIKLSEQLVASSKRFKDLRETIIIKFSERLLKEGILSRINELNGLFNEMKKRIPSEIVESERENLENCINAILENDSLPTEYNQIKNKFKRYLEMKNSRYSEEKETPKTRIEKKEVKFEPEKPSIETRTEEKETPKTRIEKKEVKFELKDIESISGTKFIDEEAEKTKIYQTEEMREGILEDKIISILQENSRTLSELAEFLSVNRDVLLLKIETLLKEDRIELAAREVV